MLSSLALSTKGPPEVESIRRDDGRCAKLKRIRLHDSSCGFLCSFGVEWEEYTYSSEGEGVVVS